MYAPSNPAADQRTQMAAYLENSTAAISGVSESVCCRARRRGEAARAAQPCPLLPLTAPVPNPSPQLLAGSGMSDAVASSAALNASLAALPSPLLHLEQGAAVQQQALLDYYAATIWANTTA